jgi:hypothetical protein
VNPDEWFLTATERGNPHTRLDSRHPDGAAWSAGNDVRPLIHGSTYFAELAARVEQMSAGDLLLFTDWRGDPDERLRPEVCLVDDAWAVIGSANVNRRSWTHDSELCCAIVTTDGSGPAFARQVRETLAAEHLGLPPGAAVPAGPDLVTAFRSAAARLDAWHEGGRAGSRPPGQLRSYPDLRVSRWTRAWTRVPHRLVYDPDGRPRRMRAAALL